MPPIPSLTFGRDADIRDCVKRLRLLRRWDQATLGHHAGMSAAAVSQIETGKLAPTDAQTVALAGALGYSAAFLTRGSFPEISKPWLRAYADASRREADARTAAASVAAEYIKQLRLTPLPDRLPHFDGELEDPDVIDDAANELRVLADIESEAVVANAVRAAERLGCVVLPLESEMGRHLGMSLRTADLPMLCVAKRGIPGDRQRFTVAHELAHLSLHRLFPPPRDAEEAARLERQANRFAAAFLTPGDALLETLDRLGGKVTLTTLAHAKSIWGVSIKSLVGRLQVLNRIDTEHARSLYKQISARQWSRREPVEVPTETAQWFARSLLRRAGADDLRFASDSLAEDIGGNGSDLFSFVDWSDSTQSASIVDLMDRRRRVI